MKQKSTKPKRHDEGTLVIFLTTDLEHAKPVTPEKMDEVQRQVFAQMTPACRQKVLEGCGTVVADLETKAAVCTFNMEHHRPPKAALESLARQLHPAIMEFCAREEERRKAAEEGATADKQPGQEG